MSERGSKSSGNHSQYEAHDTRGPRPTVAVKDNNKI